MEGTPSRRFSAHDAEMAMRDDARIVDNSEMPTLGTTDSTCAIAWEARGSHSPSRRVEALEEPSAERALDAFLASREENPIQFAASFLHLNMEDRMRMTAALLEEKECHVDVSREEDLKTLLAKEVQQWKESTGLVRTAAAKEHDAHQRRLGYCPREELEMIELEETDAVHTGNMALFFSKGKTDVRTVYDNFFDEDASGSPADLTGARPTSQKKPTVDELCLEFYQETILPARIPSLDDFLSCDDPPVHVTHTHIEKKLVPTQVTEEMGAASEANVKEDAPSNEDDNDDDGEEEEEEELELPGLENAMDIERETQEGGGSPSTGLDTAVIMPPRNTDFALTRKDLQELRKELDNSVQPFHLDPLVDYNHDLVGASFRQHGWRDTDIRQTH